MSNSDQVLQIDPADELHFKGMLKFIVHLFKIRLSFDFYCPFHHIHRYNLKRSEIIKQQFPVLICVLQ